MYIQQLSLAILAMVIFFSFIDYKKTVLLWLPAQLLFNAQVAIRYESPAMSLQIAVNIFLLGYYYLKCNIVGSKKEINRKEFPFWKVSIFILLSYILSSIVSPYGTFRGFTSAIKYFVTDIGSVFLAFKMIESDKDVRFFIKSCFFVFLLIVSLGISEFILKDNLWADFVYVGSPHDETTEGRMFYVPPFLGGGHEMRYGMIRAISTFGIHIAFGVSCVVYFWLFLVMKVRRFSYISSMKTTIMIVLLLIGVFLCNSKTGMVGLVLILLSVFPIGQLL